MKLTFTTPAGELVTLDLAEDMELENVKALCEDDLKIPSSSMTISLNGQQLTDDKMTLLASGLKDGDVVLVQSTGAGAGRPPVSRPLGGGPTPSKIPKIDFSSIVVPGSSGSGARPSGSQVQAGPSGLSPDEAQYAQALVEEIRRAIDSNPNAMEKISKKNPDLLDAVMKNDHGAVIQSVKKEKEESARKIQMLFTNPDSLEAQQLIHDQIRQQAIQDNFEYAVEHTPEALATVHMLYVNCSVNGKEMKAFVDSGAQTTIISREYAQLCNIAHLIDERYDGMAVGVGTQRIIGKIHACQMTIGGAFLTVAFTVLEERSMQILLGLDMLKRHQMVIDLKRNVLVIGTSNSEAPFLSEAEIPDRGIGKSIAFVPNEGDIQALIGMGFSREQSRDALVKFEGNKDAAASELLSKQSANSATGSSSK